MNSLIIYGGDKDIKSECDYSYNLSSGKVTGTKSLNNSDQLNNIALKNRENYCDFIYKINEEFIKNKITLNDLSLFFLTDLSNKRTEFHNTYNILCVTLHIKSILKKYKIKKIIVHSCNQEDEDILCQLLPKHETLHSKISSPYNKKSLRHQFLFAFKLFISILVCKFFFKINKNRSSNIFITRYPKQLRPNLKENKYGSFIKEEDHLLITVLSDGVHQNMSIKKLIRCYFELSRSKRKNISIQERFNNISDILIFFYYTLFLHIKIRKVDNYQKYQDIDLSPLLTKELERSLTRIPRLIINYKAYTRFFENEDIRVYYHLFEMCYGRMISYTLNKQFPKIKSVGFQHGPIGKLKMLYYLSAKETNSEETLKKCPTPKIVLAEDKNSCELLRKANYKNVIQMDEIYRLSYLKNIKRENIKKGSYLIALGLHDGIGLLKEVRSFIEENPSLFFFIKPHPRSNITLIRSFINHFSTKNFMICEEHITYYLKFVENVIFTYSSIGDEAKELNINTININLPGRINESTWI